MILLAAVPLLRSGAAVLPASLGLCFTSSFCVVRFPSVCGVVPSSASFGVVVRSHSLLGCGGAFQPLLLGGGAALLSLAGGAALPSAC